MLAKRPIVLYLVCGNGWGFFKNVSFQCIEYIYSIRTLFIFSILFQFKQDKTSCWIYDIVLSISKNVTKFRCDFDKTSINFFKLRTSTFNPSLLIIPMFWSNIVSGRDKCTLSPIIVVSDIKNGSSLLSEVPWFDIWKIFCYGKCMYCIRVANLRKLSEITNISLVKVSSLFTCDPRSEE